MTSKIEVKDVPTKEEEQQEVFAWVNEYQQHYFNTKYPKGLESFADFVIPTNYNEQVQKAKELRDIGLVDRLLRIRQNYTLPIKGFKFKDKRTSKRQQIFYKEKVLPLVQSFARQWVYEYNSISEVFANYGFKDDGKTPDYLRIEDAELVTPIDIFGKEMYELRISPQLKKQIQRLKTIMNDKGRSEQDRKTAREILAALPEYLKKAIDGNGTISNTIILSYENMYRSTDQKPDYKLRPKPGLLRIAKQLMLREFLIDLDFVNAFGSQKTSLTHVKAGTKEKPWAPEKTEKLHKLITEGPPGDKIVTTPGDCEITKVDNKVMELLDSKKYEQCNKDILDFFGITIIFIPTEIDNVNNQTVIVSLKPFEQEILAQRKEFERFLKVYFSVINSKNNGFLEIPEVEYEFTNIKDSKELIAELTFLFEKGVISFYDLVPIFGYDIEEQLESKRKAWENRTIVSPTYENSQGLQNPLVPQEISTLQYLGFSQEEIKEIIREKYKPKIMSNNNQTNVKQENN